MVVDEPEPMGDPPVPDCWVVLPTEPMPPTWTGRLTFTGRTVTVLPPVVPVVGVEPEAADGGVGTEVPVVPPVVVPVLVGTVPTSVPVGAEPVSAAWVAVGTAVEQLSELAPLCGLDSAIPMAAAGSAAAMSQVLKRMVNLLWVVERSSGRPDGRPATARGGR